MQSRSIAKGAFRLSRIHAEGWNAARLAQLPGAAPAVNPHPKEPERGRWLAGFASAQTSGTRKSR